jgi:hypothetical protein
MTYDQGPELNIPVEGEANFLTRYLNEIEKRYISVVFCNVICDVGGDRTSRGFPILKNGCAKSNTPKIRVKQYISSFCTDVFDLKRGLFPFLVI